MQVLKQVILVFQIFFYLLRAENLDNPIDYETVNLRVLEEPKCVQTNDSSTFVQTITSFGKAVVIPNYRCNQLVVNSLFRPTEIQLSSKQITHMIITDREISSCSVESFMQCPKNSTICVNSINRVEETTTNRVGLCLEKFYVYTYVDCGLDNNGLFELNIGQDQDDKLAGCLNVVESPNVKCSQYNMEPSKCGLNSGTDDTKCDKNCYWIDCSITDSKDKSSLHGQCVSIDIIDPVQMKDVCLKNYEYAQYQKNPNVISNATPNWCGGQAPKQFMDSIKQRAQGLSWWQAMLVVFGFVLFIFLLTVCWYRYKMTRHNVAPFTPPNWCPEAIYPRAGFFTNIVQPSNYAQQFINFDTKDQQGTQYVPPQ